ncbi:MAG TPA: VacJ family lipoprotein [Stellaceae bacterium]|jgi:phospholipid-binding lipoprotein MlaA|nr:VacJ family lipoprotein [Stellaceae bacterium]
MTVCRLPIVLSGLLAIGLAASGCAAPASSGGAPGSAQTAADDGFNDPYENTNRAIFDFNTSVDHAVLAPVARTYRTVLPQPVRQSVHDFLQNLNGPVIFANDVLQGDPKLAGTTLARLAVNTTVGVGGMFDVASRMGLPYHWNDLGVTLGTWGIGEGPYLVVPVFGPSNPRDLVGKVGDGFADPGNIVAGNANVLWATFARAAADGVDQRQRNLDSLEQIERTSLDYYATIRSLYRQQRQAEMRHEHFDLPGAAPASEAKPEPAMTYTVAPSSSPAGATAK